MTSNIMNIAEQTGNLLYNLNCTKEYTKIRDAKDNLKSAVQGVNNLSWNDLFAIEDEKRHDLTTCQQKVAECYATLKRELLIIYKELFQQIKDI